MGQSCCSTMSENPQKQHVRGNESRVEIATINNKKTNDVLDMMPRNPLRVDIPAQQPSPQSAATTPSPSQQDRLCWSSASGSRKAPVGGYRSSSFAVAAASNHSPSNGTPNNGQSIVRLEVDVRCAEGADSSRNTDGGEDGTGSQGIFAPEALVTPTGNNGSVTVPPWMIIELDMFQQRYNGGGDCDRSANSVVSGDSGGQVKPPSALRSADSTH